MSEGIGYENDKCHWCGAGEAGYWREEDGKMYDACMKCAKKAKVKNEDESNEVTPRP